HGRPNIVHSSRFDPKIDASDVVQVGPRLISSGKNTIGLKNIHAVHHRSGIALDKKGNVIIYATSSQFGGISWNKLRYILKLKKIGGYEVLNLDGGGSTQMYISAKNYEDYVRGLSLIPSAIAFFRKE
ncbi:MAG: phosphodiester glycosidase family protein, partial [Nitrospinota bacterium]|nr:phosphodiester glycosidase family protein [Nitrospinota bacterium]